MQKLRDLITCLIILSTLTEELPSASKREVEFGNMPKLPLKIPYLLSLEMSLPAQNSHSSVLEIGPSVFHSLILKL